jgi:hypothetical protein
MMLRTVEAEIDGRGQIRLLEAVELSGACRALVVILEPEAAAAPPEPALLAEPARAEDWNRAEEDAAWSHLQQGRSS